jgi:hypothetical protein
MRSRPILHDLAGRPPSGWFGGPLALQETFFSPVWPVQPAIQAKERICGGGKPPPHPHRVRPVTSELCAGNLLECSIPLRCHQPPIVLLCHDAKIMLLECGQIMYGGRQPIRQRAVVVIQAGGVGFWR